jgi:hypothetical protein
MPSRRNFHLILIGTVLCAVVASPFRLGIENGSLELAAGTAAAKDGKGKGNGGNGNGGKGKGGDRGGKSAGSEKGAGKKGGSMEGTQQVNPKTGDRIRFEGAGIEVVHRNGMRERVYRGSYKMTDSKGRTIIERRATGADLARLRRMAG